MGIIEEGTISGTLPSNSSNNEELFAVHYPAYPSSMERAIETLGGSDGISKARGLKSNKLELRFRPEDPWSHPAFGELQPSNNFLLRISKIKVRDVKSAKNGQRVFSSLSADPLTSKLEALCPDQTESAEDVTEPKTNSSTSTEAEARTPEQLEEHLCADIVARVSESYHFNGMVDYQHVLAVHADVARRKKRNWSEVEPQFEKGDLMDVDQEDLMILVPPLFSLKDVPEKVVLKPSVDVSLKKKQEGVVQHRWEMAIEPSLAIDFYINEIPKKVNWEKYIPQESEQWQWQKAVCDLFDEHPIWVKDSLIERLLDKGLKFGGHMLRRLLFRIAYYFSNGPFLRFWIRKGYDPRKDPESRVYQRIDFRVPPSLRSYCDANMASGAKHKWIDICAFRVFPFKCQTSMQLFELEDDYIQQEIKNPTNQATCSCATGWFPSHVLDSLRLCVAMRFLSVYPKVGAESLLKSVSIRFEKSKRTCILAKDLRLDEEGQPFNRDVVGHDDKEPNHDKEDAGDEEDDFEDDNVEEDMDEYEAVDMAGDEGNFSLQHSTYNSERAVKIKRTQFPVHHLDTDSENVSTNYLQELFGSFPYSGAGDEQQDGGNSDGEYQIYEQYSDGNYSDEDDC